MELYSTSQSENRLVSKDRQAILLTQDYGTVIKLPELMKYLRGHFRLDWTGIHGAPHWARVLKNGMAIALSEGARGDVVTLFAFLHDHERFDDHGDPDHGARAVENLANLRDAYFTIDDAGFNLLCDAIAGHSFGGTEGDITIQTCYDADRLDLGRVGVMPHPKYLCTDTAKNPDFLREAYERSIR